MNVSVTVKVQGLDELLKRMDRADAITVEEHGRAMTTAVAHLQAETIGSMEDAAVENQQAMASGSIPLAPANPERVQNILQSKVTNQGTNVRGEMKSKGHKTFYLTMIENGRAAGKFPPVAKMAAWAQETLGVDDQEARREGRRLSRAIGLIGIRGNPVLEKSLNRATREILQAFDQANERIVERLAKG